MQEEKKNKKSSHEKNKKYNDFLLFLLSWYKDNARKELPWRKNIKPYSILVSEIMLQQTQVSRVMLVYKIWMKKWPTLASLSEASLQEVLTLWKGLGYQRRAKALCAIAKTYTSISKTYEGLIALPSVGDYTAKAVLTFSRNEYHVLLETNIKTVIIHHFLIDKNNIENKVFFDVQEHIVEVSRERNIEPRILYWAMMDYGAHLKKMNYSYNNKVKGYKKQTPYKNSTRKLRAEILYAYVEKKPYPLDKRSGSIIQILKKEGFITE